MTALCGWIGEALSAPETTLATMGQKLGGANLQRSAIHAPQGALLTAALRQAPAIASDGALHASILGNPQFADTADVQWHTGVDMATYSNKVYLLDALSKQIWRYQRGNTAYSGAGSYFSAPVDELSDAVSVAVDGSVWVLLKDGQLLQYFAGDLVDYVVKKAPLAAFEGVTRVYTDADTTQLYILDAAAKRIFVYDKSQKTKDITYSSQYALDVLSGPVTDFFVNKSNHMVYLTTDTGLYQMNFTESL